MEMAERDAFRLAPMNVKRKEAAIAAVGGHAGVLHQDQDKFPND